MDRWKKIFINTMLLTLSSLLMRTIGMSFQVYLTNKIGAAGIGLFQLIMSVYALFVTFAISGIRFATTRLLAEELGADPYGRVNKTMRKCLLYALLFGTTATVVLIFSAEYIGLKWLKDAGSILSLKILSTSLPFLAMSSVFSGYFTAVCRVYKSAVSQLIEQLARIIFVVVIYSLFSTDSTEFSCAVIMAGSALGDIVSFSMQYILYIIDRRRYNKPRNAAGVTVRMFNIALPLALSSYGRTALSTLQQLLVPAGFRKHGLSAEKSLSDYGIIHGMVLPILTFPSAFFYSLGDIIVPELTVAQINGKQQTISAIVNRTLRICTLIAIGLSVIFFKYSDEIGMIFFKEKAVVGYVKILSFLMPVMYLDSITDGLLRGLGLQLNTMWINIADSVLSVFLVYTLLPKWAVNGYLFIICFTEVFNFTLSLRRLSKVSKLYKSTFSLITPLISAIGASEITLLIIRFLRINLRNSALSFITQISLNLILYMILLRIMNCITASDMIFIKRFFKKDSAKFD